MANVTIYTLAEELHMTPSMVSRALNPNGKISEEKRKIVLAAAERHGFSLNRMASRLSRKSVRIGILLNSRFEAGTRALTEGIRQAHEKLKDYKVHYDLTLCREMHEQKETLAAHLAAFEQYDGVIVSGMSAPEFAPMLEAFYARNRNLVQVQSVNRALPCLFASQHDERAASSLAAEFLSNALKHSKRKNLLLFTGSLQSALHARASASFCEAAERYGLRVLKTVDMQDDEEILRRLLPEIFSQYGEKTDGIYITSGVSLPLCEYLERNALAPSLVTFDVHDGIKEYLKKGVISATVSQDMQNQMRLAFENLAHYLITGEACPPVVYTDLQLVFKSNMHQFN